MNHRLTFHTDPGHGWVECPKSLLLTLGDAHKHVSEFSYATPNVVYLEEDSDAPMVIGVLKARGDTVSLTEKYSALSFIRNLPHYKGV